LRKTKHFLTTLTSACSRIRRFNTANNKAGQWTRSWASSIHLPSSQPVSLRSILLTDAVVAEPEGSTLLIPEPVNGHDPEPVPSSSQTHTLIVSSHLLGLPSGLFPRSSPLISQYKLLVSPSYSQPPRFHYPNNARSFCPPGLRLLIGRWSRRCLGWPGALYKSRSSSLHDIRKYSPICQNIFLSALSSNTWNLCCSLRKIHHDSYPYRGTDKLLFWITCVRCLGNFVGWKPFSNWVITIIIN
jgi:hypothetical protein